MNPPRLRRRPDGSFVFDQLTPAFLHVLHELPDLLGRDQPDAVRQRLYPPPTDDEEQNKEWERLVHPELFALLASSREIILKDLATLGTSEPDDDTPLGIWRFVIPAAHVPGWLSALNAGRLALGALYELEEGDMHDEFAFQEWSDKQLAIAKVHLLGWLQQMLIEEQGDFAPQQLTEIPDFYPADEFDEDEDEEDADDDFESDDDEPAPG